MYYLAALYVALFTLSPIMKYKLSECMYSTFVVVKLHLSVSQITDVNQLVLVVVVISHCGWQA